MFFTFISQLADSSGRQVAGLFRLLLYLLGGIIKINSLCFLGVCSQEGKLAKKQVIIMPSNHPEAEQYRYEEYRL